MKKLSLIFSVLFLDFLTFSAAIALLPLFFLDTPHSFFAPPFSLKFRYILLGLLSATYPLAQTIAAPCLGYLSDRMGRRGILLSSYLGNTAGYLICSLGVFTQSILPFFIGNFIAGMTGVNISTTNAIISDVAVETRRSRFFALSQLMLGLGFILGPWLAGQVMSVSSYIFQSCFYLFVGCAAFSFLNFCLIFRFWSKETEQLALPKWTELRFKDFLRCEKRLKTLLGAEFLIFFGWFFFIKTFQVFLIEQVGCTEVQVLNIHSQYGFWFALTQGVFIAWLYQHARLEKFFRGFTFLFAFSIFMLSFMKNYTMICYVVPFFTCAYASLTPSLTALVSDYASSQDNGKVMGLHQSIQAVAKILGPVSAGILLTLTPLATVIFSPLCILAGGAILKWGWMEIANEERHPETLPLARKNTDRKKESHP